MLLAALIRHIYYSRATQIIYGRIWSTDDDRAKVKDTDYGEIARILIACVRHTLLILTKSIRPVEPMRVSICAVICIGTDKIINIM